MDASIHRRTILGAACSGGALAACGSFPVRAQSSSTIVETTTGKVRGAAQSGAYTFKGIPYAASTAGTNRFLPPAPATPWAGIRDADHFGNSAPQGPGPQDPLTGWYGAIEPVSEDCLSLNIFTPGIAAADRRPVMVWLHGGAWGVCAGSAPGFDGTNLAKLGDVVVVTVNHRLNLFGYIRLDDKDDRFADAGNAGVLDLVAALRWVRDNISAFGGDPGNVTIFGQSGGGAKVSALMATPAAHGLFHKAIAQSCSGSLRVTSEDEAAAMAHAVVAQLGVPGTGEKLQGVPMPAILAALTTAPRPFRPVLDGRTFTANPFDPAAPAISSNIPFMAGNAATEATLYMAVDRKNFSLDAAEVARRVGRFLRIDASETNRVMEAYRTANPEFSPSELLAAIATDYTYRRNTTREAALQSSTAQAPVYAYVFDWKTPVWDGLLHTPHTSEVPFVFGTTPAAVGLVGDGPAIAPLTKMMIATWSAFARTGNPNNPALPHWPQYDGKDRSTMMLDLDSHVASNPGGEARASLDPVPVFEYTIPVNYPRA
jgi:para-nitrobenzyl esterase